MRASTASGSTNTVASTSTVTVHPARAYSSSAPLEPTSIDRLAEATCTPLTSPRSSGAVRTTVSPASALSCTADTTRTSPVTASTSGSCRTGSSGATATIAATSSS
ncbi:hypothetical protein [Nocardia farcinica]|uniref:hypothetical protein n=1 Tax=Nocardia farcinica TaxID=37329 RepID=UPI0018932DB7|nr:hypothetical protein [Nocardia farcinica]MBF6139219.1 hypothetical protein [Nocardia farcinica]